MSAQQRKSAWRTISPGRLRKMVRKAELIQKARALGLKDLKPNCNTRLLRIWINQEQERRRLAGL